MEHAQESGRVRVASYVLCQDDDGRVLLCHIAPSVGVGDIWTLPAEEGSPRNLTHSVGTATFPGLVVASNDTVYRLDVPIRPLLN